MRITLLFLVASLMNSYAGIYSQKKVTVNFKEVELIKVMDYLEDNSDFRFLYQDTDLNLERKISIQKENTAVETIVDELFEGTEIVYQVIGTQIVLNIEGSNQQMTIRGKVTDANGNPLPGVNVMVGKVGSKVGKGVATDFDGNFSINATKGQFIRFSYVGFITQEIIIDSQSILNITLKDDVSNLEEVVITGYQMISKERATGAFAKVDAVQLDKPAANISERLVGSVAGLSSSINADGTIDFEIRGQSSLFADQQPLIVVDGFAVEDGFNTINPNDVESVTVLKDAAAASIWGAKSANGVIVITTKKAKKGQTNVDLSFFVRTSSKLDLDYVVGNATSAEQVAYDQRAFDSNMFGSPFGGPPGDSPYDLNPFSQAIVAMTEAQLGYTTDSERDATLSRLASLDNRSQIEDYLLQKPFTQQYNLNISGGNEKMTNKLSLLFDDSKSYFQGDNSQQYLINYNTRVKLAKGLNLDFAGMMQYTEFNKPSGFEDPIYGGGDMLSTIRGLSSYDMLMNTDGSYADMTHVKYYQPNLDRHVPQDAFPYSNWSYNVVEDLKNTVAKTKQINARINAGLTYEIIEGLNVSSRIQYELFNSSSENYYNDTTFAVRQFINETSGPEWQFGGTPSQLVPSGGVFEQGKTETAAYNWRNQANFNHTFSEKHAVNVVLGSELNSRTVKMQESPSALGYDPETLTSSTLLKDLNTSSLWNFYPAQYARYFYDFNLTPQYQFYERTDRYFSLYTNASYTYNDKYSVSASYRTDASNIIADDPKYRYNPFWHAGLGWQLGKEDFMADVSWVNRLNVRATYGVNGNVDNSTSFRPLINLSSSLNQVTDQNTAFISSYGNPTLRWEKTKTFNFGVDFDLLNNKLFGSFEIYNKKGTDLIVSQTLSAVNGTEVQKFNNGEMLNKGFETTLGSSLPIKNNDIVWTGSLNFSYNKNEVTSLFKPNYLSYELVSGPTASYAEGYDANTLWSYVYGGMTNVGSEANPILKPSIIGDGGAQVPFVAGYPQGNGLEFMENQGTLVAPYNIGMKNSFKIYDFNFSFIITAKLGHVFRRQSFNYNPVLGAGNVINRQYSEVANGDPNEIIPIPDVEPRYYFYDRFYPYMNYLTANAGHIRFQEINLTYTVPATFIDKIGFDGVNIYATANNVGTILFNDFGEDPEYPRQTLRPQAMFTFGMQFNF